MQWMLPCGHICGENGRKTALYPLPAQDALLVSAAITGLSVRPRYKSINIDRREGAFA
jgi:hypothetical protein